MAWWADDVGKPSSCLPRDLVTRWSWNRGCHHFLSLVFDVNARFVYGFVVVYIWVNSDTRGQLDYNYIGTLGCFRFNVWDRVLCRLTGNYHWYCDKFNRIRDFSLANWYGDRLFFQIRVRKDSVQINHCHSSENYANFIHRHRALPTITRIDRVGRGGGVAIQTKLTAACAFISSSRFRPSLTGLVVAGRSAEPRLRSHGVCKSI